MTQITAPRFEQPSPEIPEAICEGNLGADIQRGNLTEEDIQNFALGLEQSERISVETAKDIEAGVATLSRIIVGVGTLSVEDFLAQTETEIRPNQRTESETLILPGTDQLVHVTTPLSEMLIDESRDNMFSFFPDRRFKRALKNGVQGYATEQMGLLELDGFLERFTQYYLDRGPKADDKEERLAATAESLRDGLTFIGEREYKEAVAGLGQSWKEYLDGDRDRMICVLAEVGSLERYYGQQKSDARVRDQVLATFTDEELQAYSGRIVGDLSDVTTSHPDDVKVVLVDDWSISGDQIRDVFAMLSQDRRFKGYVDAGSVEINMLVASSDTLADGINMRAFDDKSRVPVKAYFQARPIKEPGDRYRAHYGGVYSAPNYGYRHQIEGMAKLIPDVPTPSLTRINRPYHGTHKRPMEIEISSRALRRNDPDV
jgi:hypothetical protein